MKQKENAYTDFIRIVTNSWTWLRMTESERATFWRLTEKLEEAAGTYDNRMKVYHSIYTAFLYGLGYDGFKWRETAEIA